MASAKEAEKKHKMKRLFLNLLRGSVNNLAFVDRYATFKFRRKENVAEHSYYVALYSLIVAEELFPGECDRGRLLTLALLHDLPESLSGDFVITFKRYDLDLRQRIEQASFDMMHEEHHKEGLPSFLAEAAEEYDKDNLSIESWIVTFADRLHVATRLIEEADLGNTTARQRILERYIPGLNHQLVGMSKLINSPAGKDPKMDDARAELANAGVPYERLFEISQNLQELMMEIGRELEDNEDPRGTYIGPPVNR
jgi:5'-deoxynucleotidase YfbR-like HD superfamily hydrolase